MLKIEVSEDEASAAAILAAVNATTQAVQTLTERIEFMAGELDRLRAEVAETGTVIDSAVALIGGLAQQIRDLKTDPAALEQLANDLDAKQAALAAAVTANTDPGA